MTHHNTLRGMALAVLAALLWGTTGTAQSLGAGSLAPLWVGALRLAVASVFFALLLRVRGAPGGWARLPWPHTLLAALCVASYNLSFFAGLRLSGVALGTALAIGSGPLWAGLMQAAVLRRWPGTLWWLGTLVGVAGGVAMALDGGVGQRAAPLGLALCLLAGASYAGYALLNKTLVAHAGALPANLAVFGGAALLALPAAWGWAGPLHATPRDGAVALYLGLVATGLAYWLYSSALRSISAATGVTLALAEPVMAFALAVAVLRESPSWLAYAGLAAVLAGLAIVVRAELRAPISPQAGP